MSITTNGRGFPDLAGTALEGKINPGGKVDIEEDYEPSPVVVEVKNAALFKMSVKDRIAYKASIAKTVIDNIRPPRKAGFFSRNFKAKEDRVYRKED